MTVRIINADVFEGLAHAILIELSEKHAKSAKRRIEGDAPLFVGVDLVGVAENAVGVAAWGSCDSGVGDPPP